MATQNTAAFLTTTAILIRKPHEYVHSGIVEYPLGAAHVIVGVPYSDCEETYRMYEEMRDGPKRFDYVFVYFTLYSTTTTVFLDLAKQVVKEDGKIILIYCGCDHDKKKTIFDTLDIKIALHIRCGCGDHDTIGTLLERFLLSGEIPERWS